MITEGALALMFSGLLLLLFMVMTIAIVKLWIELESMKRSTHKVTFIDPTAEALKEFSEDQEFAHFTDDQRESLKQSQSPDMDIVA